MPLNGNSSIKPCKSDGDTRQCSGSSVTKIRAFTHEKVEVGVKIERSPENRTPAGLKIHDRLEVFRTKDSAFSEVAWRACSPVLLCGCRALARGSVVRR